MDANDFLAEARRWADSHLQAAAATSDAENQSRQERTAQRSHQSLILPDNLVSATSADSVYQDSLKQSSAFYAADISAPLYAEVQRLQVALIDEQSSRAAADARCHALEEALERYSRQGASLEAQLEHLGGAVREELVKMSEEADEAADRIRVLETELKRKSDELDGAAKKLADVQADAGVNKANAASANDRVQVLSAELDNALRRARSAEDEVSRLRSQLEQHAVVPTAERGTVTSPTKEQQVPSDEAYQTLIEEVLRLKTREAALEDELRRLKPASGQQSAAPPELVAVPLPLAAAAATAAPDQTREPALVTPSRRTNEVIAPTYTGQLTEQHVISGIGVRHAATGAQMTPPSTGGDQAPVLPAAMQRIVATVISRHRNHPEATGAVVEALPHAGMVRAVDRNSQRMFKFHHVYSPDGEGGLAQSFEQDVAPITDAAVSGSPTLIVLAAAPSLRDAPLLEMCKAAFASCYTAMQPRESRGSPRETQVSISVLDVYRETVRDVLAASPSGLRAGRHAQEASILPSDGKGATRVAIKDAAEAVTLITTATQRRQGLYEHHDNPHAISSVCRGFLLVTVHITRGRGSKATSGSVCVLQLGVPGWIASTLADTDSTEAARLQVDSAHITRAINSLQEIWGHLSSSGGDEPDRRLAVNDTAVTKLLSHVLVPTASLLLHVVTPSWLSYTLDADAISFYMMAHALAEACHHSAVVQPTAAGSAREQPPPSAAIPSKPLFAPSRPGGRRHNSLSMGYLSSTGLMPDAARSKDDVRGGGLGSLSSSPASSVASVASAGQFPSHYDLDYISGIIPYRHPKQERLSRNRDRLARAYGRRLSDPSLSRSRYISIEDYLARSGPAAAARAMVDADKKGQLQAKRAAQSRPRARSSVASTKGLLNGTMSISPLQSRSTGPRGRVEHRKPTFKASGDQQPGKSAAPRGVARRAANSIVDAAKHSTKQSANHDDLESPGPLVQDIDTAIADELFAHSALEEQQPGANVPLLGDPVPGMRRFLAALEAKYTTLSPRVFEVLRRFFIAADAPNTGRIGSKSFALCLHKMLQDATIAEVDDLVASMYLTSVPAIDYMDFVTALQDLAHRPDRLPSSMPAAPVNTARI